MIKLIDMSILIIVGLVVGHCSGHKGLGLSAALALCYIRFPGE